MGRVVAGAIIACVLIGGGITAYHYSGARGDVAKKKVLDKIDNWLGESDVRRAEIDRGIKGIEEGIVKLSNARIKAQVQAELLGKELAENKLKIEESKAALVKLKGDLSAFDSNPTYTVSYGTKSYGKKDDLEKMAAKVIDFHKSLVAQTASMAKRHETYETTASTLAGREEDAKKKLASMRNKLQELDAKIEMVKAQKAAAEALSETDTTFASGVASIEKKIKDLDLVTTTKEREQDEDWKKLTAGTKVEDVKDIIKDSKSTINEIDALLGK